MSRFFFSTLSTKEKLEATALRWFDKSTTVEGHFVKTQAVEPIFSIYRSEKGHYFPATDELIKPRERLGKKDAELMMRGEADFIAHVYPDDLGSYEASGITLPKANHVVQLYKEGKLVLKSTAQNKNVQGSEGFHLTI